MASPKSLAAEMFKCDKCDKEFQNLKALRTHRRFAHVSKRERAELIQKRVTSMIANRKLKLSSNSNHRSNSNSQHPNQTVTPAEILAALILKRDALSETIDHIRIMIGVAE